MLCFACVLGSFGADAPARRLRNPDFESPNVTNGWGLHVFGARPQIAGDTATKRQGQQALRILATEPSDTALGQEAQLTGGAWYQFSGWIKTRGLQATDAPVLGTLQVQHPGGRGTIVSGANQREWPADAPRASNAQWLPGQNRQEQRKFSSIQNTGGGGMIVLLRRQ
jgi:hypothetical protein